MVRAAFMITYRLVPSRRHAYQLLHESDLIAEIAIRNGERANVITPDRRYELEVIEGIRKRVVQHGERNRTIARSSSLGRYAVDLDHATLYWHSLPGPPGTNCWMTGDGLIVVRYSPAADRSFILQIDDDGLLGAGRESLLILGCYLTVRPLVEAGILSQMVWPASLAFEQRSR